MKKKRCKNCKQRLVVTSFNKNKSTSDGLSYWCKQCNRVYLRQYYSVNKSNMLAQQKRHYEDNKERILARCYLYTKQYRILNREKVASTRRQYEFKKRREDLQYRLRRYLRKRLWCALKGNFKSGSAVRDLGCSIKSLKKHLERQFRESMSWDNYGDWHIDHVKPLSSFNLSEREELLKACHYTNLQPLWKTENLEKGNT